MLSSKDIVLRPMELADAETVRNQRFSMENYPYFFEFTPVSKFTNEQWFQNTLLRKNEINFIIYNKNNNSNIGMICLVDLDQRNQKCEMARVLIWDKMARGKGYGKQAIQLLLEYAFKHLNMHKVFLEVFADNTQAVELYKKCGFIQDGLFLQHIYKDGIFRDVIHMAVFKPNN